MAHLFEISQGCFRRVGRDLARALPLALLVMGCVLLVSQTGAAPAVVEPAAKPATIKISGYGILGNRGLKRTLTTLELAGKKPEVFDATFIEDASLVLLQRIRRDGFLDPRISVTIQLHDGDRMEVNAAELLENPLPRPLYATGLHFKVSKGPLFFYDKVDFQGLQAIPYKQALGYFVEVGPFFDLKTARIYTPERLSQSLRNLSSALDQKGYREVEVTALPPVLDHKTGAVSVTVNVNEGPRYIARTVRENFDTTSEPEPREPRTLHPGKPYSHVWEADFAQALKTNLYARGFPDVKVTLRPEAREETNGVVQVDLVAEIVSGPRVKVGNVIVQGNRHTSSSFISRRLRVTRGEWLNPIRMERARSRLAELGTFNSVELSYRSVDGDTRDVVYNLNEAKRLNLSLLFGWGSYELLRGGFEAEYNNIWGLSHRARLKAVQSFKATSGDLTYTVPDFNLSDLDLFLNGFFLKREEINFTREEYGGGIGVHKYLLSYATDVALRYNYQILNAASIVPQVASEGLTNPAVGSIVAELRYDRRDNPLYPSKGLKFFLTSESASDSLGGQGNYQRVDLSAAWHVRLGGGGTVSLGLGHGFDVSFGSPANNLPFNKRFFPGGANSIRGYQDGEASPRNEEGKIVGAESYLLGSVEFEQALTPNWSLVVFSDSLGIARRIADYPFDETLFSVGGGLRWRTIVGPVRLEYGHNLNPRPKDPAGTLQFSLGYPF